MLMVAPKELCIVRKLRALTAGCYMHSKQYFHLG